MALATPGLTCLYTTAVDCGRFGEACEKCGWNPIVARERKEKLRAQHGYAETAAKENE